MSVSEGSKPTLNYPITFVAETNHHELADAIVTAIHDHEALLEFMVVLDEAVADYDFTVALRDRLTAAIVAEDVEEKPFGVQLMEASVAETRRLDTTNGRDSTHYFGDSCVPAHADPEVQETGQ